MKSIKSILMVAICMVALLSVSCSNESEQKKTNQTEYAKGGNANLAATDAIKLVWNLEGQVNAIDRYTVTCTKATYMQGGSGWTACVKIGKKYYLVFLIYDENDNLQNSFYNGPNTTCECI